MKIDCCLHRHLLASKLANRKARVRSLAFPGWRFPIPHHPFPIPPIPHSPSPIPRLFFLQLFTPGAHLLVEVFKRDRAPTGDKWGGQHIQEQRR
jgi:hypothetical protein